MKSSFISIELGHIHLAKKSIKSGLRFFNKIKDMPTLKWIEELTREEIDLMYNSVYGPTLLLPKVEAEIVCGLVGELERKFNTTDTKPSLLYGTKEVSYTLKPMISRDRFSYWTISIRFKPKNCEWKIEETNTHHYTTEDIKASLIAC